MTIELKVSAAPELTQNLYEAENDELCSRTQLFEKIANKKGVPRLEEHLFMSFSKWITLRIRARYRQLQPNRLHLLR